eukprot:CAMPEP_0113937426 /NCGR_PEP_ID=MMETSP1339-20121228/4054_1 /TAXON_ID=94617 /ORGANISM="Fibrocapsa japonica" /LENGTH=166 /DNA_ID=CAMNT_0000940185 /DNA_START=104 /DNA_END=604 /DNA_ORIENTATION=- /assembly_acc=CAM_ASM_000762
MDPVSGMIMIRQDLKHTLTSHEIRMFTVKGIEKMELMGVPRAAPDVIFAEDNLQKISPDVAANVETETLLRVEAELMTANPHASAEGQMIYDALSKTLPCSWGQRGQIEILDQVVIAPPYTAQSCRITHPEADPGGLALARVVKVLEGERRKMAKQHRQSSKRNNA